MPRLAIKSKVDMNMEKEIKIMVMMMTPMMTTMVVGIMLSEADAGDNDDEDGDADGDDVFEPVCFCSIGWSVVGSAVLFRAQGAHAGSRFHARRRIRSGLPGYFKIPKFCQHLGLTASLLHFSSQNPRPKTPNTKPKAEAGRTSLSPKP